MKNGNVDGRVFYNEWYRNKVRRYELYFFWLKIESSVCCFLVASNCCWLIEVNIHSSDLLNVSIFANRYYSWVDFEPPLSNDTKAHACDFALPLTTGNLESWFRHMDTYFLLRLMPSDDNDSDVVWSDRHESCRCFFFRGTTAPSGSGPPH
jgi:hypothetical protein